MIRYVDRGWRDFGYLIDHEANRNSGHDNDFLQRSSVRRDRISHNIP